MFLIATAAVTPALVLGIILFAAAVGTSIAAQYLLRPKIGKASPVQLDNEATSVATRGAWLPFLIGKRRVGNIFAWVGGRYAISAFRNTRGKGSRGRRTAGFSDQLIFFERGVHLLCVGPVKRLWHIYENGVSIFDGPIDNVSHPSGTLVILPGGAGAAGASPGSFTIFWGELNQPINTVLGAAPPLGMGVSSRWPLVCYVFWSKRLGAIPRWPLLEYEIETEVQDVFLNQTPPELLYVVPYAVTGKNPAHVIGQLLFSRWPHGLSQDKSDYDLNCLEILGKTAVDESMPISAYAPDGQDALGLLSAIMQDLGCLLPWDIAEGRFRFKLIRPEAAVALQSKMECQPLAEVETNFFGKPVDKLVFAYADEDHKFKTVTIAIDDDGQAIKQDYQKAHHVEMRTIINFDVAKRVAERRSQEELARATKFVIFADRGARLLFPGTPFTIPEVDDVLRVSDVSLSPLSGKVQITAVTDIYGSNLINSNTIGAGGGGGFVPDPPKKDLAFTFIEVPAYLLSGNPITLVVPRIRDNVQMSTAEIELSTDNVTYKDEGGDPTTPTGGTLTQGVLATDAFNIAQGPQFTTLGPDIANVLDLSGDPASWKLGQQMALIGEELFFLQKVTAIGGTTYRLDGLIRARYDTARAAHAIGDTVYIFQDTLLQVRDAALKPDALIYIKTDPSGLGGAVDLSTVVAVSKTLYGKGVKPMGPAALRTVDQRAQFRTGQDVQLKWAFRSAAIQGTGAGLQRAGSAVGQSPVDGRFELRFYDLGMVLKKTVVWPINNYTYQNAAIIVDFGSEQSIIVEVRDINGGWRSGPVTLRVDFAT